MASKENATDLMDSVVGELRGKLKDKTATNSDLRLAFDIAKAAGVSFHASSTVPDLVDELEESDLDNVTELRERYGS